MGAVKGLTGPVMQILLTSICLQLVMIALPVGTVYDPFVCRGLDALNYACYQDARFLIAGTPSGVTLAPEGGAHQSISTPLIGMAQDGLASFEPAFAQELAIIMEWAFDYMQRDGDGRPDPRTCLADDKGGAVYLRLTTRPIEQAMLPCQPFNSTIRLRTNSFKRISIATWRNSNPPCQTIPMGVVAELPR